MTPSPTSPTATISAASAPHRVKLDQATVVTMALALADAEGLEALTIRRLAKQLGVTPTALYWHFADKQALLDAMCDQMWADAQGLVTAVGSSDVWAELRQIFEALVAVFRAHPAMAPMAPTRVMECPPGLVLTERALDLLARAGYDDARAADAARFLLCTAIMMVTSQPGSWLTDEAEREALMRQKRAALMTLPAGQFPRVEAAAPYLTDCDQESLTYYALGIDLVLAGLQANAAPALGSTPA